MDRALGRGVLAVVACLAAMLPGVARADESLNPGGSLTYVWQAEPSLGCAAQGLCGVRGALSVDITSADIEDLGGPSLLDLEVRATSRSDGPGGSCVDTAGISELELSASAGRQRPGYADELSSGRCAGPLTADLLRLPIDVIRHGTRRPSFSLRGTASTTAGPFSISVRAGVRLTPGPVTESSSTGSSGTSEPPRPGRFRLYEEATMRYLPKPSTGRLTLGFISPAPFCTALGACGATGTIAISTAEAAGPLTIIASRRVGHRVSRARVLADLRRGRLVAGGGLGEVPVRVTETDATGTAMCAQTRTETLLLNARLRSPPELDTDGPGDILRTWCPGPVDEDVIGDSQALLRGTGPLPYRGERRIALGLSRRGGLVSGPYAGRWTGQLAIPLQLESLRARIVKVTG